MMYCFSQSHRAQVYIWGGGDFVIWRLAHVYVLIIRKSVVSRQYLKATQALPLSCFQQQLLQQNTSGGLAWRSEFPCVCALYVWGFTSISDCRIRAVHAVRFQGTDVEDQLRDFTKKSRHNWFVYSGGVLTSIRLAKIGRRGTTRGVLFRKR